MNAVRGQQCGRVGADERGDGIDKQHPCSGGVGFEARHEFVVESQVVARLGEVSGPDEDDLRVGPGSAGVRDGLPHRLEDVLAGRKVVIASAIEDHGVGIVLGREVGDTFAETTLRPRGTRRWFCSQAHR